MRVRLPMSADSKQILGPPAGYVDYLNESQEAPATGEARKYFPLRPSSAGKCERELAHELAEYRGLATYPKEVMKAETKRIFDMGHSVEYSVLKQFDKVEGFQSRYGQQTLDMFDLNSGEIIEGSLDKCFFVTRQIEGKEYRGVIDIKSKKDKFSSWSSTNWSETDEKLSRMASVERITDTLFYVDDLAAFLKELGNDGYSKAYFAPNFIQLNMYANNDFLLRRKIDHASIIQYNKNDSRMREVRFRPSAEVYQQTKEKFLRVEHYVDVDKDPTLAKKEFVLGSIKCAFCQFNKECWPEADALKEYFATWPKRKWPERTSDLGDVGDTLEDLYEQYYTTESAVSDLARIESELISVLEANKIQKVKFADDAVFELKFLKSPRPHLEFRRTK